MWFFRPWWLQHLLVKLMTEKLSAIVIIIDVPKVIATVLKTESLVTLQNVAALIVSTLMKILTLEHISKQSHAQLPPCLVLKIKLINSQPVVAVKILNVRKSTASVFKRDVIAAIIANVKTVIMGIIKMTFLMRRSTCLKWRRNLLQSQRSLRRWVLIQWIKKSSHWCRGKTTLFKEDKACKIGDR